MSVQYKILVNDRNYTDWNLFDALSLNEIEKLPINPASNKLFSSDIFEMIENKVNILHSSVRCMPSIPGILVLKGNKTFGRIKDKFLYKCIPDDRRFPEFLMPYNVKLGFSKNIDNKYIVFKFNNWDGKHPQGTVVSVLGDVDILSNFYEYQLYCKSLYASIQEFNKVVSNKLKKKTAPEFISSMISKYNLKDRSQEPVYSIDSKETTDYDDAFSIIDLGNNCYKISIYISNVPLWMEELDLWNSFSERISTIYLPDRKRPMMPLSLSNCVCSLCEQEIRLAFGIDITIKDNEIIGYCLDNSYIKVYKNHVYESKELKKDANYKLMFKVVTELSKDYKYLKKINDSHDMVAYLMILMNYYTSRDMVRYNNGIYRSVSFNKDYKIDDTLPDNVNNFLRIWNSSCGQYDLYDERKCHEMLELESYIHCTSPIRRLVDLLNMAKLQKNMKMVSYGEKFDMFYEKWTNRLEYINTTMRAIRKIQTDCSLLHLCSTDNTVLETEYDGYVFDKIVRNDGLFQYIVYLENLKSVSRITSRFDLINFQKYKFKVFVFQEEATLKKKIRLHILL
jgi:exoribonuclease R|uniref:RNB domain-containing protein n=1 Tax=viral metagenome TaxID=1070528 RepID=A0A6C0CVZ6_9ZZZZ